MAKSFKGKGKNVLYLVLSENTFSVVELEVRNRLISVIERIIKSRECPNHIVSPKTIGTGGKTFALTYQGTFSKNGVHLHGARGRTVYRIEFVYESQFVFLKSFV